MQNVKSSWLGIRKDNASLSHLGVFDHAKVHLVARELGIQVCFDRSAHALKDDEVSVLRGAD